ncbi:membrane protein [Rhodococcus gordoniae]|uniref:Membrane protein n=1 Tax=Rhodococcus gordoniae TaxID=223392 RepID=A0A379LUK4_9NOCA|nr:hypothetical protein [Rhodococcus gordoniae]UTT50273.1 hypothetical protein NMQ04_08960 [Rhodococcus gordoniae]SUE13697.1 membrane protein [Rhodococcus gordoniae]
MPVVRRAALVAAVTAFVPVAHAGAQDGGIPVADLPNEVLCTPGDPALAELSGLAAIDGRLFATPDAGGDERILELDDECSVRQRIPTPVDPYDVEDLAAGPDGRLWLGDLGDNTGVRETIALISLDPETGQGDLHRLTYPDGPRDAETVLVSATGEPVIVTKALFGSSTVYRPARGLTIGDLPVPGPAALEKVGSLALGPSDTPGGPVPGASSSMITGGAVSADGTVAAVRTYTDVYLFHVPDGDLAAALVAGPRFRIPVPDEPQGEAVAFTTEGDLLTASERGATAAENPPIRIRRGATELFVPADDDAADETSSAAWPIAGAGVAAGVIALAVLGLAVRRRARE